MDPCTVETGLLRKKPCGHPAVAHCANCEQPLCAQHAVAQHTETGGKSGKFLCQQCEAARSEHAKRMAANAKSAMSRPPLPAKKPVAPAKEAPAKDAAGKKAPAESKPGSYDGGINFTPGSGGTAGKGNDKK
jgi:hypothetical protein